MLPLVLVDKVSLPPDPYVPAPEPLPVPAVVAYDSFLLNVARSTVSLLPRLDLGGLLGAPFERDCV